jgi:nucleotide-binding universal stress UspA family protein
MTQTMFRHILCPIDFSDTSRHALNHAVAMARWSAASLTVLHVCKPHVIAVSQLPDERAMSEVRKQIHDELNACVPADAGLTARIEIEIGDAAHCILQRANDGDTDLVVIGTHGLSGFDRLVLGSVAEKVLRKAACPVLTIPPRAAEASASPFRRILAAVDFSDCSLDALTPIGRLARAAGAEVTLIHVIAWPWEEPPSPSLDEVPPPQAEALREYRRYVTRLAETRLKNVSLDDAAPAAIRVAHGRSYTEILRAATEMHADLIALCVSSRGAVDLTLFGSTANHVVRQASCPVLTYRR